MQDLITLKQFDQLTKAIDWSIGELSYSREKRVSAIKDLVGKHYTKAGSDKIMPVNGSKLMLDVFIRHLAPRNPRGMFTSNDVNLRPTAKEFELAVNQIPSEIGLTRTLRQVITESILSPLGIVKCGLDSTDNTFVDCVTIGEYFCDLSAKDWSQIQYEGNDYWMEYEDFKAQNWDNTKDIKFDAYEMVGSQGERQASSISASSTASVFRERIWLRDVWLPKERLLLTYGVKSNKLFNVVEWDEDVPSPYIKLGFSYVPGNLLPLPPIASQRDLNEVSNAVFRKLGFSADAYKEVLGFSGGDDNNTLAFKNARHGDGIKYTGAEPKRMTAGGIDAKLLAFWLQLKELQSYYGGNYDSLGGLAAPTQTIGQDRLLSDAASAQLRDMADQTTDFVRKIFEALAYYEWHNPKKSRIVQKQIEGTNETLSANWNEGSKKGSFSDYRIDIDVYSLQDDSPMLQLQKLGVFIQQYVLPFVPAIQQAGGTIDVEGIIKEAKRLANLKIDTDIVSFPDDPVKVQPGSQNQYIGAPQTLQEGNLAGGAMQSPSSELIGKLLNNTD